MTYSDAFNIRATSVKFNDVADAIDGVITRGFAGTSTGTSTAYIVTPSPAWASYDTSASLSFIPHVTNTAGSPSVSVNVNGLGAKVIKIGGADLTAGVLVAGLPTILIYTGVHFEVIIAQNALLTSGSNSMLADLNFGGFRPSNLSAGTAAAPAICAGNDVNTGIFSAAADQIGIATNGTERVRIDSTGKVGIGTTAPADIVEVATTGFWGQYWTNYPGASAGGVNFAIRKSRGAAVGTNTIVANNDIVGSFDFQGANGTTFTSCANIAALIDGAPGASNDMPGRLVFSTTADGSGTPTERMWIDSSGRVGIQDVPFSSAQFYVRSQTSSRVTARFYQAVSGDTGTPALNLDKFDNNTTSSQIFLQATINQQSTGQGQINAFGASQLAFGTYSDERLKENIAELPSQLGNILALRPVEFDYKDGTGHQIGFIAQEVQEIYPDLVAVGQNEMLTLSGLGKWESRLVKAIQELNAKVEALEAVRIIGE